VLGEVLRPATYEIRHGEQLDDLIRAAGGFTAVASRQRIQIERVLPPTERTAAQNDRVVLEVTAGAANAATPSVALLPGDIVRVFRVAERVRNRVVVEGNVWRPGPQGFAPNMRVSDALRTAGGLRPDVYLGQVLVSRLQPDSSRTQLRASLRNVAGEVINDFALQADDEIRVFSVTEFRPDRYVAITGSVRNGGQFPYREGMTVRDLVLLAGGLEEHAFLREAEVARLPETRANGVTASTFRVPLDSSYLFERGPDGRYVGVPGLPAPSGTAPEVPLRPYDNVLVLRQPDWELQRTVVVEGQVRYPGRYALRSKNERLTDVIERAGGLTPEAYAEGITFVRNANRLGRIGVDLPSVLRNARHRDNLLLQDGDSVFLPIFSAVVNVTGAVNSPVAVAYVPGADINFYIRAAGGPAQNADLGRAYVTQSSGKVESTNRRRLRPDAVPEPRPGSRVFVPERPAGAGRDFVAAAGAVAQILASLVAITVAVVTARRR
jgi:protein involved in polysaccharide export with SLBB domain